MWVGVGVGECVGYVLVSLCLCMHGCVRVYVCLWMCTSTFVYMSRCRHVNVRVCVCERGFASSLSRGPSSPLAL